MTIKEIADMSYTDFIGFVNQWNVPPGSYNTLSKWITFGSITKESNVLELACTSGFSLREVSLLTSCSGVGIDISKSSIETAQYNKGIYAPNSHIEYENIDADIYENSVKFSHVIVGAALKFFPNPKLTIERIVDHYLEEGGLLLASPFYVTESVPESLIIKSKEVFGIDITTTNYKETMSLYSNFEILYEDRCEILQETKEELEHYCKSTIDRATEMRKIDDNDVKGAMYERLMEIKKTSNELRIYQDHAVLVLRYRKNIYPNRFTELF